MTFTSYVLTRANALAYVGIPACLFWLHALERQPVALGSYVLFAIWYVIPLGQIWGYQAKIALTELALVNVELERLTYLHRRSRHDRSCT